MAKSDLFCAHIASIKDALAKDSPVNVEQTIKGLLAQYGLGEIKEPAAETSEDVVLICAGNEDVHIFDLFFIGGIWCELDNPMHFFGNAKIKMIKCPDCQKHEREKQLK